MPESLHGIVLDCEWDRERLWRLPLPVSTVTVRELAWHLRLPLWAHDGVPFSVTPAEVLRAPAMYPAQHARVMAADLSFPVDLLDQPGRPTVLDGVHRLAKAWRLGYPELSVRLLPLPLLSRITVPGPARSVSTG
jgi:hypothetical protein